MSNIQNVKTGTVEIPDEDFEPKNYKVRITIMIDGDILDSYKELAEKQHTKYQTLMNQKLREALKQSSEASLDEDSIQQIRKIVKAEISNHLRSHKIEQSELKNVKARKKGSFTSKKAITYERANIRK